jgi:peptide/nickel transport system substrate-binding protein
MRMVRYCLMAAAGLALALVGALAAAPAEAKTPGDALVMAKDIDDIVSLDPGEAFELSGLEITTNVYDRLMRYDAEDVTKLVGGAAESWTLSPDKKTFTFKVRPGIKFSSGAPLTAEDIAFSLQRSVILNKAPAYILQQLGWDDKNVKDLVKVVDPMTVTATIKQDFGTTFVLNCFSANLASIVEKKVAMAHETNGDLGNGWLKTNSAGSGAYVLKSWKADDSVVLEANPNFWKAAPKLKRVIVRHVKEPSSQRLLLEKGDIDMARDLTPDMIKVLSEDSKLKVSDYPKADEYYLGLNAGVEALKKPKVREALRWLIDYQGMAATFLKGQFQVQQAFWPAGFPMALNDNPFKLDVPKGKALLAEAGYPNGFEVTMDVPSASPFPAMAQSIQSTMAQAGIKVTLQTAEQKQVITKYRARQHQIVLLYWSPDYQDPHANASAFAYNPDKPGAEKASTVASRNNWFMPDISEETLAAARENDAGKREQMYLTLQKKLETDSPILIMFQKIEQTVTTSDIKGFVSGSSPDTVFFRLVTK